MAVLNNKKIDLSKYSESEPLNLSEFAEEVEEQPESQQEQYPGLGRQIPIQNHEESFLGKLPRNILAGLAGLGRNVYNAPHDILNTLQQRGQELGEMAAKGPGEELFRKHMMSSKPGLIDLMQQFQGFKPLPRIPEHNYAQMLGQQGEGTFADRAIQKSIEHAPEILGVGSLLRSAFRSLPITKGTASIPIKEAKKMVSRSEMKPFDVDSNSINNAHIFLPKTRSTDYMLHNASQGNYDALFSLQSQLGQKARSLRKSILPADRDLAPVVDEIKSDILTQMTKHLIREGRPDIAKKLMEGRHKYRQHMKLKENVYPVIKKVGIPITAASAIGAGGVYGYDKLKNFLK